MRGQQNIKIYVQRV